jgi:hypothetical protein
MNAATWLENLPLMQRIPNIMVSKVTKIGGQLVSIQGGVRYYLESIDTGPEGFGLRAALTLLFPK